MTPESARLSLKRVFTLLGSGQVPSSADILTLRPIFEEGPFALDRLSAVQVVRGRASRGGRWLTQLSLDVQHRACVR